MSDVLANFSQAEAVIKAEIERLITQYYGAKTEGLITIDYPPQDKLGDFTVSCFSLASQAKKSPTEMAKALAAEIKPTELITAVKAVGPYLNFFTDRTKFSSLVLGEINKKKLKYGAAKIGRGQKVMVEYFSPNTNKPLTIGHVRNICLGWSIAKLFKFLGYKVIESTLYNDRGIAIAKVILGYQKWGNNQTPKTANVKPDHFVGEFYVRFCQAAKADPNLESEARLTLQAWEKGEVSVKETWQKLISWVLAGFDQTLNKLGTNHFEEKYYESEYYSHGKKIVDQGLKKGIFIKDKDGVVVAPLEKFGLVDKILLRPDDTSLYITQDLYLAHLKDKHHLDQSIYVVGSEQDLYFQQLFKILELLGLKNAKNYYHLSYGMVRLPSGKIKSREGLIEGTGADNLIDHLEELAKQEIISRFADLNPEEVKRRAERIALAALKFYILAVKPKSTIVFEPQKSVALIGKTGPYLQYVYARINSIFEKNNAKITSRIDYTVLSGDYEFNLVKLLSVFPVILQKAVANRDPSLVANYLYDLAKAFSVFYEQAPVLAAEPKVKKARLVLINNVKIVLSIGFDLLGIPVLEKM